MINCMPSIDTYFLHLFFNRMDVYASQTKRMQMFLWATSSLHVVLLLVAAYQREIGGVFNLAAVMALGKMLNDVS